MLYECIICNFRTYDSGAWCRHKKRINILEIVLAI